MPKINAERLIGDLKRLRQFGAKPLVWSGLPFLRQIWKHEIGSKINTLRRDSKHPSTASEMSWAVKKSRSCVIDRLPFRQSADRGWLDGAMGVIYGLEIVRALRKIQIPVCLQWMLFRGRTKNLGFSVRWEAVLSADNFLPGTLDGLCDKEGYPLEKALDSAGLERGPFSKMEQGRYLGYLEGHIEQGPQLELEQKKIELFRASSELEERCSISRVSRIMPGQR